MLKLTLPTVPRSQDECVNMCTLRQTLKDEKLSECINYNNLITADLIEKLGESFQKLAYCSQRDYLAYLKYIRARRYCVREVCKRNCLEEEFDFTYAQSECLACKFNNTAGEALELPKSVITLWPDKTMVEKVSHNPNMNAFELIGYLGGHAHLWLGLSAIQIYEVSLLVFYRLRFWYLQAKIVKQKRILKNRNLHLELNGEKF